MFVSGFLFALGVVAALGALALLFLTEAGRWVLWALYALFVLALCAGGLWVLWLFVGWMKTPGVSNAIGPWVLGAVAASYAWLVWVESKNKRQAKEDADAV